MKIAAALEAERQEAVLELCEGDDCFVARKEQEAYEKGRKAGREEEQNRFDKECPTIDHVHFKCRVIEKSNQDIRQAALEEAAEIAEDHNGCTDNECFKRNCPVVIAERIRRMKGEVP
jgi:hypothetical protein